MAAASSPHTLLAAAVAEALRHSKPRHFEHTAAAAAAAAAALHVMLAVGLLQNTEAPPSLNVISSSSDGVCSTPKRRSFKRNDANASPSTDSTASACSAPSTEPEPLRVTDDACTDRSTLGCSISNEISDLELHRQCLESDGALATKTCEMSPSQHLVDVFDRETNRSAQTEDTLILPACSVVDNSVHHDKVQRKKPQRVAVTIRLPATPQPSATSDIKHFESALAKLPEVEAFREVRESLQAQITERKREITTSELSHGPQIMMGVKPADNILKVKRRIEQECGLLVSMQRLAAHDDLDVVLSDETKIKQIAVGNQLILQVLPLSVIDD